MPVNEPIYYFDGVAGDRVRNQVGKDANEYAMATLLRRRPDLRRLGSQPEVPDDEKAQFELDRLAHTRAAVDRLMDDVTDLVLAAREQGASWLKVGLAINESPQTALNRYQRFEVDPTSTVAPDPAEER